MLARTEAPLRLRLSVLFAFAALAAAPAAGAVTLHDGYGLHIVTIKQVDARMVDVTFQSAALPDPVSAYILFPPGYNASPRRHWPVFYLLHGTSGMASDWTVKGDAEKVIGDRPLITVMPDIALNDGGGGWCTNWPDGAQSWEAFHIDQLIPWVDSNLRTVPTRQGRAIAGRSQGGFCSMSYAARHPDLFGLALGYSGAPDIYYDPEVRFGAMAIINATEVGLDTVPPDTFFGDPVTDGITWAAHDPATLAENLRGMRMYMYWGNGEPGPYDSDPTGWPGGSSIEGAVNQDNNYFQARLNALHIPAYFDPYGAGTHSWPYWTRDLQWSIGPIMDDFAHPRPSPAQVTYTSGDDGYSVYGWSVSMHRTAREFSTLADAATGGFELSGSGSGTVTTPARFRPGARYTASFLGPNASGSHSISAGPDGRLRIDVPLGPANPYQEYTLQAQVAGTAVYTTSVTIRPA
jgi:S-formylglutathione hydrolase FrmB